MQNSKYILQIFKKESTGELKLLGNAGNWKSGEKSSEGEPVLENFSLEEAELKSKTLTEMGYFVKILKCE